MTDYTEVARKSFEDHHRESVQRSQDIVMEAGRERSLEVLAQVLAGDIQPQLKRSVTGEYTHHAVQREWVVWCAAFLSAIAWVNEETSGERPKKGPP